MLELCIMLRRALRAQLAHAHDVAQYGSTLHSVTPGGIVRDHKCIGGSESQHMSQMSLFRIGIVGAHDGIIAWRHYRIGFERAATRSPCCTSGAANMSKFHLGWVCVARATSRCDLDSDILFMHVVPRQPGRCATNIRRVLGPN